ncbi:MAG: ATP-binding cassette domain-containing protein, partial [Victivallaceae bacterium]|nr:ATP-binding cassette domain-containing protein [Victivallaceae bacterium]
MAEVLLENICKIYEDDVKAVDNVNLEIRDREFMVLVGPSGCGKSTTLRMVAGLEQISSGTIKIGERIVNDVPPKNRDIAMVFQNYALYPHMSVQENMAFGLRLRKFKKADINM